MSRFLRCLELEPGVTVGLDPHLGVLPSVIRGQLEHNPERALTTWSCGVLDAIAPHVAAVKPQVALYERHGVAGVAALTAAVAHAKQLGVPVLLDAKRGDIGSTAEAYAAATLDDDGPLGADAVTLSPYLGPESLQPFLKRAERGKMLFLLLRTSNPGAEVWQAPVAERIAAWVRMQNERLTEPRVGVVIGATVRESWREQLPQAWFLMPGIGAQGASLADVAGARRPDGRGVLPAASRSMLSGDEVSWQAGVEARVQAFAAEWAACYQHSP